MMLSYFSNSEEEIKERVDDMRKRKVAKLEEQLKRYARNFP